VVHRYADPATGEVRRPVAAVPPITVLLPGGVEYVRANRPVARVVRVHVQSTASRARDVTVGLTLPPGLRADSASRRVTLPAFGQATVQFTVRGTMAPGMATMYAEALSEGERFNTGFVPIEYPHIAPRQFYRPAGTWLSAVDVRLPAGIKVAYVPGVGDNVAPMLDQLDIPVTTLDTASLATADLTGYTAIVVGPRAYEANDALVAANPRILEFARRGGTVVVQYGQYEMQRPGIMPYPIVLGRPADRVTEEQAAVRIVAPASPIVRFPNRIDSTDFVGWVQERSIYMPRSFDAAYTPVFELADPGEPPNRGAVLVARVGRGTYVYTTFSFFRQLPMGVPGAARLFVNLLGAGSRAGTP